MNAGMIRQAGGEWHWSLDAFNDYLIWPQEAEYELELLGSDVCRARLGHQALAARLRARLSASVHRTYGASNWSGRRRGKERHSSTAS